MSARQIAALLGSNKNKDDDITNNRLNHPQQSLQYYPNNVPSFIDYTQNDIIQNNIPVAINNTVASINGSYLQPTLNNMTINRSASMI